MPLIHAHILEGRSAEAIERLIVNVTAAVADSLDADPQTVRVLVHETPKSHWGIGGETAARKGRL